MEYLFNKENNIYYIKENKSLIYYKKYINRIKNTKYINCEIFTDFFIDFNLKKIKKYHKKIFYELYLKTNIKIYDIFEEYEDKYKNVYDFTLSKLLIKDKMNLLLYFIPRDYEITKYIFNFCSFEIIKESLLLIYKFDIYKKLLILYFNEEGMYYLEGYFDIYDNIYEKYRKLWITNKLLVEFVTEIENQINENINDVFIFDNEDDLNDILYY